MQVFHKVFELREFLEEQRASGVEIGFVPTMGALHQAHLALVQRSRAENQITVVSIFVNPTQFNNAEDLEKYPRRTESDLVQLRAAGTEVAFLPEPSEIYGDCLKAEKLDLAGLDQGMEGTYRPGHFPGVATVIKRFFQIIAPERAYFGEKDYQQLRVVQHMARQEGFATQVIGCPTERNEGGLALSSRNFRLSPSGLEQALIIPESLRWCAAHYHRFSPDQLKERVRDRFRPSELELEYVEIADPLTMTPVKKWAEVESARIFLSAFCEGVRLIDNYRLF